MTLADRQVRRDQVTMDFKIVTDVRVVVAVRLVKKLELVQVAGKGFGIENGPLLPDRVERTRLGGHRGFEIAVGEILVTAELNRLDAIGAGGVERVEGYRKRVGSDE